MMSLAAPDHTDALMSLCDRKNALLLQNNLQNDMMQLSTSAMMSEKFSVFSKQVISGCPTPLSSSQVPSDYKENKEKNKKMKDRKKKKLALQHNASKSLSCCSYASVVPQNRSTVDEIMNYGMAPWGMVIDDSDVVSMKNNCHIQDESTHSAENSTEHSVVYSAEQSAEHSQDPSRDYPQGYSQDYFTDEERTEIAKDRLILLESYPSRPPVLFDYSFSMAPMVNQSDPPFRTLCLKYGATCTYTEMLYSTKIVRSKEYLRNRLQEVDHTFFQNKPIFEDNSAKNKPIFGDNSDISKPDFDNSANKCNNNENNGNNNRNCNSNIHDDHSSSKSGISNIKRSSLLLDNKNCYIDYKSRPLIVQICGNDPQVLSECMVSIMAHNQAVRRRKANKNTDNGHHDSNDDSHNDSNNGIINGSNDDSEEDHLIDAIDFNLGCPQDRARTGLYGSYLLDKHHWPLVFKCVTAMTDALRGSRMSSSSEGVIAVTALQADSKSGSECDTVTQMLQADSSSSFPPGSGTGSGSSADSGMSSGSDVGCDVTPLFCDVIPLFCKIRVCEDGIDSYKATEQFCKGLYASGVSLIAIHGRTRGSAKRRRAGLADLSIVSRIASLFRDVIPIVSNGNIVARSDVKASYKQAYPAAGLMSAEGILADPCIFHSQPVSVCPCTPETSPVASSLSFRQESNGIDRSNRAKKQKKHRTKGNNEYYASQNNMNEGDSDNDDSISKDHDNIDNNNNNGDVSNNNSYKSNNSSDKNGLKYSRKVPDRSSLFAEYCFLSEMFFDAGGWRGLERRDDCFADDADHCVLGLGAVCSDGVADGGQIGCDNNTSNTIAPATMPVPAAGQTCKVEEQTKLLKESNVKTRQTEEQREQSEWLAKQSEQTDGRAKQIEVARQHLFWMLEKKGHGRTVRFVHLGPYRRHTDLLNDVKNACSLDSLAAIARGCLGGVYGSAIYSNDSYD